MISIFQKNNYASSFTATIVALILYLGVRFLDNLVGIIMVPLFIVSYIIILFLNFQIVISNKNLFSLCISIFCSIWIFYGIYSDLFSNGINTAIMISLITMSLTTLLILNLNTSTQAN